MNEEMLKELTSVRTNLLSVYRLVFEKEFEGEEDVDVVVLALIIRNHMKGRFEVPAYHRKRFNNVLIQMGCADFRLSEQFYAKCV